MAAVLLLFAFLPQISAAKAPDTEDLIVSVFDSAKKHRGAETNLLSDETFLKNAGTSGTDWMALAMARFSYVEKEAITFLYPEDYDVYKEALTGKLRADFNAGGITAATKLTEYQRMSLVLYALGGSVPEDIDFLVSAEAPVKLSRMNIITLSYALLTLNAANISGGTHEAGEYIETILSRQQADGGWSLTAALGAPSDPDVTAMTLTALAPYVGEPTLYEVKNTNTRETYTVTVGAAADRALDLLSRMQQKNGGYVSYGVPNCESTAQVLVALTSVGVDPYTDSRFIKDGNTVLNGLLSYRLPDGAFTHSYQTDSQNPGTVGGAFDSMATDQAAYALVSLWRYEEGIPPLYAMTPDFDESAGNRFTALRTFLQRIFWVVRFLQKLLKIFR